jgi:pimeloyl-ACP methyl ester carboxylesterase
MRRFLLGLLLILIAAVALPPLWFRLFRAPAPELPPPGRRVEIGRGLGLNVVEVGAGPAVLLVHGLPGSAYDWRMTSPALAARGLRAIAYDRVGYGWSDPRPDHAFTVESNARELLALLEALALDRATVVGWSYGGATAIAAAQLDPSRMAGLVLVGSAGPGIEEMLPPRAVAAVFFSAPVLSWLHAVPPLARAVQAQASAEAYSNGPQPAWWRPDLAANFARPHTATSWRSEGAAMAVGPLPDPSGLALPLLVLHGDDDRLAPVSIGRELARRAPNARLEVVPGGSHMLPVTHAEWLADQIADFQQR